MATKTEKTAKAKKPAKASEKKAAAVGAGPKNLGNLSPAKGSNIKIKRLGRGPGSGLGKTSAHGGTGQTARKGGGIRAGFEGGQTPLYRRLPKRGFKNHFRVECNIVNLSQLNVLANGTKVNPDLLKELNLLRIRGAPVKLLGNGKIERSLIVSLHKVSAAAKAAIEKAGGKVEEI